MATTTSTINNKGNSNDSNNNDSNSNNDDHSCATVTQHLGVLIYVCIYIFKYILQMMHVVNATAESNANTGCSVATFYFEHQVVPKKIQSTTTETTSLLCFFWTYGVCRFFFLLRT